MMFSCMLVGVGSFWLACKVLRADLGPLRVPFSMLLGLQGACFVTVTLIPAGIGFAALADLVLGMILLRFAVTAPDRVSAA